MCQICGGTPCQWIDYGGDKFLESLQSKYNRKTEKDGYVLDYKTATSVSNDKVRRKLFGFFPANFGVGFPDRDCNISSLHSGASPLHLPKLSSHKSQ